ncbi:Xaa-Pro dipeptidase [Paenibacillus selenitireducens]|uniref:Xaa-Pro dipeptidase n=1 Tax=Paenibacillus selenitireducens TaxID=1324314 RepID=A0A1T2XNS3_9BACL|nr:Xaa-Pro peptidase family protein [Paenibacillus selenitireducens]OPA81323.1 Xaa-Pro dipeptidase [Paenibacillus selenitireducens]
MDNKRVVQLRQSMKAADLEAIFITNGVNRRYLTGFTGSSGYVVITFDKAYFLTDFRYVEQANAQVKGYDIIEHKSNVMEIVRQVLTEQQVTRLGFEQNHVTFGTYTNYAEQLQGIELVPTAGLVEDLRNIKDEEELAIMQEAFDLADLTFTHILPMIKHGVTEEALALEMEIFMRKNGATSSSFDTIVASGERSALPHGVASSRVLQGNELITFDFGAYLKGYCSDLTRTVALGNPSAKHREIYDVVLEAQLHALEHIRPGMTGAEADALTRDIITRYGYGDNFGHSTGHGLGMEVHESIRVAKGSDMILKPGMVVTVEPGIYLPGIGGVRIEDDIVITDTGIKILTHSTKDYLVLDM